MRASRYIQLVHVHGDIRHLESKQCLVVLSDQVHGDIRHLEILMLCVNKDLSVHGDIRHLESPSLQLCRSC